MEPVDAGVDVAVAQCQHLSQLLNSLRTIAIDNSEVTFQMPSEWISVNSWIGISPHRALGQDHFLVEREDARKTVCRDRSIHARII